MSSSDSNYLLKKWVLRKVWKTSFLRSLTLGAIGAKTRFFKMWPKSTHDSKTWNFIKWFLRQMKTDLKGSNGETLKKLRNRSGSFLWTCISKGLNSWVILYNILIDLMPLGLTFLKWKKNSWEIIQFPTDWAQPFLYFFLSEFCTPLGSLWVPLLTSSH